MRAFGRPMNPNVQPVQDMRIQGMAPQPARAPAAAPTPAQAPAPTPERRGLLGGFFGPEGRDARARLAIALEGMTMNPNEALIGELQRGIQSRETAAQKNATVEWLKSRGREDLAAAIEGGLPAADALRIAMEPAPQAAGPEIREMDGRLVAVYPDMTVRELYGSAPAADPQSAIAKLEADRRAGLITEDQYQTGLQAIAPAGMVLETTPSGGVRLVQGSGAAASTRFTEGEGKDVVYATRARGALEVLEPVAETLTSLPSKIAGYDPTGILRGAVQSPDYQVARNAGDEFLQAILRKDTGAAITADEQALYGATYLPQPGDGPEVLAAKREARLRAVAAITAGMSPAQMIAQEKALGATGTATSPQAGPARVANDAEYEALPSGTQFIGPDGKLRRKP